MSVLMEAWTGAAQIHASIRQVPVESLAPAPAHTWLSIRQAWTAVRICLIFKFVEQIDVKISFLLSNIIYLIENDTFHLLFIVEKCTLSNGGCDSTALCRNPTAVGGAIECYCGAGKQFGSDGQTCTSIAEADLHCPSSTCWTYEMVDGNKKCVMKLRV